MYDYRQLQALATVIEEQSFERAASRLFLTQSAISQRIKQLEEKVGQLLLVRSQPLRLTQPGQLLLRHYHQVSLLQHELTQNLQNNQSQEFTRLSIGLNADSLATWFMDALQPVLQELKILLDLRVDDQDQTQTLLRQGDVIGCISASDKALQGGTVVPLGISRYLAVATPGYIEKYFPDGVHDHALSAAPAVEYNEKDELQDRFFSTYFPGVNDYPRHRVPSSEAYTELISRGFAWGMVPDIQMKTELKEGTVSEICPGKVLDIPLYWHSWLLQTEISKQLKHCLVSYCTTALHQQPV